MVWQSLNPRLSFRLKDVSATLETTKSKLDAAECEILELNSKMQALARYRGLWLQCRLNGARRTKEIEDREWKEKEEAEQKVARDLRGQIEDLKSKCAELIEEVNDLNTAVEEGRTREANLERQVKKAKEEFEVQVRLGQDRDLETQREKDALHSKIADLESAVAEANAKIITLCGERDRVHLSLQCLSIILSPGHHGNAKCFGK